MESNYSIVLFDGICHVCNRSVQFIIRRDASQRYRFASLQSKVGQSYLKHYSIPSDVDSIILIENNKTYTRTSAVLRICKKLDGFSPLLYGLIVIPRPLRDGFYRMFASKRYQLFGKMDTCMIPTKEVKDRFLEDE